MYESNISVLLTSIVYVDFEWFNIEWSNLLFEKKKIVILYQMKVTCKKSSSLITTTESCKAETIKYFL